MMFRRRKPRPMVSGVPADRLPTMHRRGGEMCHVFVETQHVETGPIREGYAPLKGYERKGRTRVEGLDGREMR
jgi:hypothetical protein